MNQLTWAGIALLLTSLAGLTSGSAFAGTDFTFFLTDNKLTPVVSSAASAIQVDPFGNKFILKQEEPLTAYGQIATSILLESVGLPQQPVYPILPTDQSSAGGMISVVSPLNLAQAYAGQKLNAKQAAQAFSIAMTMEVLGADFKPLFLTDNQGEGHLISAPIAPDLESAQDIRSSFKALDVLTSMNIPAEVLQDPQFILQVNQFLSRLEKLNALALDRIFFPFENQLNKIRKAQNLPETAVRRVLWQQIRGLRAQVRSWLEYQNWPGEIGQIDPATMPPHVGLPVTGDVVAVDQLWSHYFRMEKTTTEFDAAALKALQAQAQKSKEKIYFVNKNLDILDPHETGPDQLYANPNNSKTLLALSVGDREALTIRELAQKNSVAVLDLRVQRGTPLNQLDTEWIIAQAKDQGMQRVVVIEMAEEVPDLTAQFKAAGLELIIVDHHYSERFDRRNKFSSLEQVAQVLGLQLNARQMMIGVNDSSGFAGVHDLGLSLQSYRAFFTGQPSFSMSDSLTQSIGQIKNKLLKADKQVVEIAPGQKITVYSVHGVSGSLGLITSCYRDLGMSNVLIVNGQSLRFYGSPLLVNRLIQTFESRKDLYLRHYAGGDQSRSAFWGLGEITLQNMPVAERLARQTLGLPVNAESSAGNPFSALSTSLGRKPQWCAQVL